MRLAELSLAANDASPAICLLAVFRLLPRVRIADSLMQMDLFDPRTWVEGFPQLGIFVAAVVALHGVVFVYWVCKCMSESAPKPKAKFHDK